MTASLFHILNISQQDMLNRLNNLEQVSHNLANVNTAGYKHSRSNFQELLVGANQSGVHLSSTQVITGQGTLRSTENPMDLAVSGEGFFQVTLPDNRIAYTRDGQFHLDAGQRLVNASGYPVVWQGQLPAGATQV
ncbi:MAG: flagellar hook basal-body protein, partial [Anaerolineaceae bacterium]|nr:flagellar hook basal-body protein [Anaerolineaceae bacterium]